MNHFIERPISKGHPRIKFVFKCDNCGSINFHRDDFMKECSSFFEGYFTCSDCKKEHDYTSDSFIRQKEQLSLNL